MSDVACPRCRVALVRSQTDGALGCTQCGGKFVLPNPLQTELLEPATSLSSEDSVPQPAFACPACGAPMLAVQLAEKPLECCTECGGVWLDAGEELAVATAAAGSSIGGLFLYTLSLPERLVRSTVGMAGGVAKELSDRLVPRAFQNSSTYTLLVRNSLKFLVHDIGGVAAKAAEVEPTVDNYVARKAVGNFVDLAGMATLHLSPMLILAVVSDVAYGSKAYLKELADELQKEGLIDKHSTIANVDDLFDAVGRASGTTAQLFDTPPLSVDDLRSTTQAIRQAVASVNPTTLLPQAEIARIWNEMREVARRDDVNVFQVSSAMTLHALERIADTGRGTFSGVRLAAGMFNRHIIGHYATALNDLQEKGFYTTLSEVSAPYIEAVWGNFAVGKATVTDDVVSGRLFGRMLRAAAAWFRRKSPATDAPDAKSQTYGPRPGDGAT